MRFNPYMGYMRQAMNGIAFDSSAFGLTGDAGIQHNELDVSEDDNGIVGYLETQRRANYLVPPITLRALPPAHAARPPMKIEGDPVANDSVDVVIGTGSDDYASLYGAPGDAPGDESWVKDEYDDPGDIDVDTIRFGDH